MKARLFIENTEIELNDNVQFAITKQFEDITNPTVLINDWSKTVQIPFTKHNNELFGGLFNEDRQTVYSESQEDALTGIFFDPFKKLSFRLEYGDFVVMEGYAKVNDVTKQNGYGTYNLTLYGQLGKVLQEMKKITFGTDTEDNYVINDKEYVDETMNKDLIYSSWTSQGQTTLDLHKKGEEGYSVTDIIGFAPNNAYSDGFDYKSVQRIISGKKGENPQNNIIDMIDDIPDTFVNNTNISKDVFVGNGINPRVIADYRSYNQLPYIYFNKMFQMFQAKAEDITGYKFNLDESWFKESNPYWSKLVMMLENKPENAQINLYNKYGIEFESFSKYYSHKYADISGDFEIDATPVIPYISIINEVLHLFNDEDMSFSAWSYAWTTKVNLNLNIVASGSPSTNVGQIIRIRPTSAIVLEVLLFNEQRTEQRTVKTYMFCNESSTGWEQIIREKNAERININSEIEGIFEPLGRSNVSYEIFNDTLSFDFDLSEIDDIYKFIGYKVYYVSQNEGIFSVFDRYNDGYWEPSSEDVDRLYFETLQDTGMIMSIRQDSKRSFTDFTILKVWNNKYTLFDIILNYCKMNRISLNIDEVNKNINFIPVSTLFADYSINDYTNKVDKSKDFTIKPITWQDKYILFNSDDNKSKLGEDYKTKYGVNYGDLKITTDYNFNTNENKLYKGINTPVVASIVTIGWLDAVKKSKYALYDYGEPYVVSWDKDNKEISIFGSMLFFDGLQNFHIEHDQESGVTWGPGITDDTDLQIKTKKYTYSRSYRSMKDLGSKLCETYPRLTNKIQSGPQDSPYIAYNMFNIPVEEYIAEPQSELPKYSIYKFVWENYINERYNKDNKSITCYLDLKPSDILNFQFSNFIKLNNQLYMVNKIYDYDVTSNDSTKVDLISITDPNAYSKTIWGDISKDIDIYALVDEFSYPGNIDNNLVDTLYVYSVEDINFENGTKEITLNNGLHFTLRAEEHIVNAKTYNYVVSVNRLTIFNENNPSSLSLLMRSIYRAVNFSFTRYRDIPNEPYIELSANDFMVGETIFDVKAYTLFEPTNYNFRGIGYATFTSLSDWTKTGDNEWTKSFRCNNKNTSEINGLVEIATETGFVTSKQIHLGNASVGFSTSDKWWKDGHSYIGIHTEGFDQPGRIWISLYGVNDSIRPNSPVVFNCGNDVKTSLGGDWIYVQDEDNPEQYIWASSYDYYNNTQDWSKPGIINGNFVVTVNDVEITTPIEYENFIPD